MAKSKAESSNGNSGVIATLMLLSAVTAGAGRYLHDQLGLVPAANKPYLEWEEFYPFYLTEHSDQTCRRLHIVGTAIASLILLLEPSLLLGIVVASGFGYGAFFLCLPLPHGLIDFGLMIVIFVLTVKLKTNSWLKPLGFLVVAYAFAWVGHFFFEHNKPATFVYPLYSLVSDFVMFGQTILQHRAF